MSEGEGQGNHWGINVCQVGNVHGISGSPCGITSLHTAVMICATLVNTHTHTAFDQLYYYLSHRWI